MYSYIIIHFSHNYFLIILHFLSLQNQKGLLTSKIIFELIFLRSIPQDTRLCDAFSQTFVASVAENTVCQRSRNSGGYLTTWVFQFTKYKLMYHHEMRANNTNTFQEGYFKRIDTKFFLLKNHRFQVSSVELF